MFSKSVFQALALMLCASVSHAGDYSVGVGLSTLGVTVEPSYRMNDSLTLRAPISYAAVDGEIDYDGTPGDGKIALGGVGLLADYGLGASGFRIFGGLHATRISAKTSIVGDFTLDGTDYNGTASIELKPKRSINPMLGLGYTLGAKRETGLRVSADLGAILLGGMTGDIDATAAGANFDSDLAAAQAELDDELSSVSAYPFIKLTAEWRF